MFALCVAIWIQFLIGIDDERFSPHSLDDVIHHTEGRVALVRFRFTPNLFEVFELFAGQRPRVGLSGEDLLDPPAKRFEQKPMRLIAAGIEGRRRRRQ